MSLNWKEINSVLAELDIEGAQVQRIIQPAWDTLLLSLYKPGRATQLLFCVAHGACRLHETAYQIPKTVKPQRFTELLRAHIRGARVEAVGQLGGERIVRLSLRHGENLYYLYARLWSGAANLILTRDDGGIIDCLARKPKRGEQSGGTYRPETGGQPLKDFSVRQLPDEGSFNQRLDAYYASHGSDLSREALLQKARQWLESRKAVLDRRGQRLERQAKTYADPERYRELGDLVMANLHQAAGQAQLSCADFYRGGEVLIKLDPRRSMVDNANLYYERAKKAKTGAKETEQEILALAASQAELEAVRLQIEAENNPHRIRAMLQKLRQNEQATARRFPGLSAEMDGWLLLIGRNAAENDQLLRHHVRGNDTWLHARDYAGSYVFIKARKGKTIPLDILLSAGTLALYYSRGRKSGQGDVYYTQVKYLRRAKNGPRGLVIPTQEKNLRISIEDGRLRALRRQIGADDES